MSGNRDIEKAKKILKNGDYTCVLVKGDIILTSVDRGVKPLLNWYSNNDIRGCSAADKVVGKAAAFLYVLLGVKSVYAAVISRLSLAVFQKYGIDVSFDEIVDMIRDRTGTGYCPMEQATINISEPEAALAAIKEVLRKLNS